MLSQSWPTGIRDIADLIDDAPERRQRPMKRLPGQGFDWQLHDHKAATVLANVIRPLRAHLSQLPDSVSSWMMCNVLEEERCVALDFSGNSLVPQRLRFSGVLLDY